MTGDGDGEPDDAALRTVAGRGRDAFEVAGSEFIGHAAPARTVEEAEAFVSEVRGAHPDATHNVPAYRVRVDDGGFLREYTRDEDEPSGSAGKPALNVLQQRDLENVVIVVTRYYGGTNLGVGGLARAYGRATKLAVEAAGVVERVPLTRVVVETVYDDSGTVRGILESEGVDFEADYGERVRFDALVPRGRADAVRDRLRSATSGRAEVRGDDG